MFVTATKKVADINKDSSLLCYGINYSRNLFYDTGPWNYWQILDSSEKKLLLANTLAYFCRDIFQRQRKEFFISTPDNVMILFTAIIYNFL